MTIPETVNPKERSAFANVDQAALEALFDGIPAAVALKDTANRIVRANRAFAALLGKPREQIEGMRALDVAPDRQFEEADWREDQRIMASATPRLGVLRRHPAHPGHWFKTDKLPFRGPGGAVAGIICVFTDVTGLVTAPHDAHPPRGGAENGGLPPRESDSRYRALFDSVSEGVMTHVEGKVIDANRPFLDLFGYDSEAQMTGQGMNVLDLVAEESRPLVEEKLADLIANPAALLGPLEIMGKRRDGSTIPLEISAKPMGAGGLRIVTANDISGRIHAGDELRLINERLAESEERYRTIADYTYDWESWVAPDGRLVYVSPACRRISGYGRREFMDNPELFTSLVRAEDRQAWRDHIARVHHEGAPPDELELRIITRGGEERWINHVCQGVYDGKGAWRGRRATNRDITGKKRSRDELARAKEQAERATALKDKFVSLVAHDLKSPLTSMVGLLKLLAARHAPGGADAPPLQAMIRSGEGMIEMIEQLLDISRLKTGAVSPQPVFFDGWMAAERSVMTYGRIASDKGVRLVNGVPRGSRLYADPDLFIEVMNNLVSNAVKFCPRGGEVRLFVPEGRPSTIAVSDTGVGIDPSLFDDIFRHEVKTTTPGTEGERGTGLGLPYSRDIMEAHGGVLEVDSVKGKGSVLRASLPDVRPRVLVVDDERMSRQIMKKALAQTGAEVVEATSAREALALLERETVHLVISDVVMPEMDGFEFLERLREHPTGRRLPVILATAHNIPGAHEKAVRLGADDFVTKDKLDVELAARVRKFIA